MTDPETLRRIAEEQNAYGKWNTAPAWNRYYEAKRASQGPLRWFLGTLGEWALPVLGLAVLVVPWLL